MPKTMAVRILRPFTTNGVEYNPDDVVSLEEATEWPMNALSTRMVNKDVELYPMEEDEVEEDEDTVDLSSMNKEELVNYANANGIKVSASSSKADILAAIIAAEEEEED